MKQMVPLVAALSLSAAALGAPPPTAHHEKSPAESGSAPASLFTQRTVRSTGTVTVEGHKIAYDAVAGTIIVHPKGWDDAAKPQGSKDATGTAEGPPIASMAPYQTVDNAYSLLDASDLVFIDAPGTGFSRIEGKGKEHAFWGVDQDADAFASFITQFLSKYDRWNSPKYLFGESYGTPRSAVLINDLETDHAIDFNGVILLSQVLNFNLMADFPQADPGVELPYEIALPTMAATAWYHHMLGSSRPADLQSFLDEVEQFALGDYADALAQGANLPPDQLNAIAAKLHDYTGLPLAYIKKADLRISGPQFSHELLNDSDQTTGRLDTRFSGPSMDPLGEEAEYDPQAAGIASAYVSAFNDYARRSLHYTTDEAYRPEIDLWWKWEFKHQPPGAPRPLPGAVNVMPDLATAMKYDPGLKICLNGGYFDLATPFFQGMYEMRHLQIPARLQSNIEYYYYESGHMVYANETSLKQLHDNVAAFIRRNSNQAGE